MREKRCHGAYKTWEIATEKKTYRDKLLSERIHKSKNNIHH